MASTGYQETAPPFPGYVQPSAFTSERSARIDALYGLVNVLSYLGAYHEEAEDNGHTMLAESLLDTIQSTCNAISEAAVAFVEVVEAYHEDDEDDLPAPSFASWLDAFLTDPVRVAAKPRTFEVAPDSVTTVRYTFGVGAVLD